MKMSRLMFCLFLFLTSARAFDIVAMGEQQQFSRQDDPPYADPEPNTENFEATIKDEGVRSNVKWLTFFGHQTLGGVRKESDDSRSEIDFADIRSIKILDRSYESKRYSTKHLAKIQVTFHSGKSEDLLIPHGLVICARSKENDVKKSWYLNKVDEIIVEKGTIPGLADITAPPSAIVDLEGKKERLSKPVALEKKEYEKKVVKIVGTSGPGEKKGIFEAFNDIIASIIAFFKAIFNTIKRAIFS